LFPSKDRFYFIFALSLTTNIWHRSDRKDSEDSHQRQEGNQRVTTLALLL
jgi:hypothetical protein